MSDYLANLAAKALGRTEPVRPRLSSRFEPVGALPLLPAEPTEVEAVSERPTDPASTIRVSAQPVATSLYRSPPAVAPIAAGVTPRSPLPSERSGEIVAGQRSSRPLEADAVGEPTTTRKQPASFNPPPQEDPTPTRERRRPETPLRVEIAGLQTEEPAPPDTDEQPDRAAPGVEARMRGIEGRLASLEASAVSYAIAPRQGDSLGPGVVTRALPRSAVAAPTAQAAAPVVVGTVEPRDVPSQVSVTIGRVEVRATFPAPVPAPRTPAARAGATTLAEYLKQRERGRR